MTDYDSMSDEQVLERCRAARSYLVDARARDAGDEAKLCAFMEIFHPDHKLTAELRQPGRKEAHQPTGKA